MTARADGCVFCDIVAGHAPATIVHSWTEALAIVPLCPVVDGHVLVIPKVHVAHAATSPHITGLAMAHASAFARRYTSANLITSIGAPATQSVFHLHIHVIPRSGDDGLMLPWGTLHGEDPKAPHRCRRVVDLERQLAETRG